MSSYKGFAVLMAGTNGVGKTTYMIDKVIKPYKRSVIVALDDDSESQFDWLDTITNPDHIKRNLRGKCKILVPSIGKEEKAVASEYWRAIYEDWTYNGNDYQGGLIYLDDGKAFVDARAEDIQRLFKKRRQHKHDIVFCCHGLSEFPLSCYKNLTHVILGRTLDSSKELKNRLSAYHASILCDAVEYVRIMAENDPFYKIQIDLFNPPNFKQLLAQLNH